MSEEVRVGWICARCARRNNLTPEPAPVVLRLCSWCRIENWVTPMGHAGQDMVVTEEEREAARLLRAAPAKREAEVTESIPREEEEMILVAQTVKEAEEEDAVQKQEAEPEAELSEKEKEIAELRAKLAELEGAK